MVYFYLGVNGGMVLLTGDFAIQDGSLSFSGDLLIVEQRKIDLSNGAFICRVHATGAMQYNSQTGAHIFTNNQTGQTVCVINADGSVTFTPRSSAPASPVAGQVYYDSSTGKLRCWSGAAWNDLY